MKRFLLCALVAVAPGCRPEAPEPKPFVFEDKFAEYQFLKSLSNPTPEQWTRRVELAAQPDVKADDEERIAIDRMMRSKPSDR